MQLPLPDHRNFDRFRLLRKRWRGEMEAPPWCRRCGYSVQALMKPVCPECGSDLRAVGVLGTRLLRFRWSFVLAPIFVVVVMFAGLVVHQDYFVHQINILPGRYVDWVFADVQLIGDPRRRTSSAFLRIEGKAAPQWRMSSYPLQSIELIHVAAEIDDKDEEFVVDLAHRTFRSRGKTRAFDDDTLKSWLNVSATFTAFEVEVTQTLKTFFDSIGDGTITPAKHHRNTIEVSQQNGWGSFQINYFCFSYNSSRNLYNIGYWLLVLLVVYLGSRGILRLDRPRRLRK